MAFPAAVTAIPGFLLIRELGLLNTFAALILPTVANGLSIFVLKGFFDALPRELYEAATIDGAGEWQIFSRVCFPLCKGAIASAAILVFIDYWNMVEQPLILLSDSEMHPLSVFLSKINSGEIGLAFAVATIYMIPGLLVFLYGEEYLVDGITYQGGIKG